MLKYVLLIIGCICVELGYSHMFPLGYNGIGFLFGLITMIHDFNNKEKRDDKE